MILQSDVFDVLSSAEFKSVICHRKKSILRCGSFDHSPLSGLSRPPGRQYNR